MKIAPRLSLQRDCFGMRHIAAPHNTSNSLLNPSRISTAAAPQRIQRVIHSRLSRRLLMRHELAMKPFVLILRLRWTGIYLWPDDAASGWLG